MTSQTRKSIESETTQPKVDSATLRAEKEHRWRLENAEAIRAENEDIEKHGLPLAKHRLF